MVRAIWLAAGAALTALLSFGQTPPASKDIPSVGVYIDFDSVPASVPMDVMKHEVDKILKPSGVALDWRLTSQNHGDEVFAGLVVLKFKGKCKLEGWGDSGPGLLPGGEERTLGTTRVMNGNVLPFTEVRCDEVKRALAYLRPEANQRERQKAFGLALGRVVAHELYHILAHTTSHAARGLAKASESLQDLVTMGNMGFRDEDSTAIRKGLLAQ
jgi:hypothetical protein